MSAADGDVPPTCAEAVVVSAVIPLLAAAGVPGPTVHAPEVVGYLRRFGFAFAFVGSPVEAATADRYLAMALDITIVEGHGGPRTCGAGTRDSVALRRRLDPVGLHLARIGPEWPSCRPAPPPLPVPDDKEPNNE